MPNFSIKEAESKVVKEVTFHKKTDYKAVKLKTGEVVLLHHVQAEKLIEAKKATEVKDVKIDEGNELITVTKLDKDN